MPNIESTEANVDWGQIHKERKDKREERWNKHLDDLKAIAIIIELEGGMFRIFLPDLGQCDFYVRADKLKVNKTGDTRINGFKKILRALDLYLFEGKIEDKKKGLN